MRKVQSWHQGDICQGGMAYLTFNAHSANDLGGASSCLCLAMAGETQPVTFLQQDALKKMELLQSLLDLQSISSWTSSKMHSVGSNSMFSLSPALPLCILHNLWLNQGFAGLVKDRESSRIIVRGVTVGWFLPPPCILTTVLFFSFIIWIMQQYYTERLAACKAEGGQYYGRIAWIWNRHSSKGFGQAVITHIHL